ncbi:MAG: hypothetical protein V1782_04215 [Pseudomonadota bacterium]
MSFAISILFQKNSLGRTPFVLPAMIGSFQKKTQPNFFIWRKPMFYKDHGFKQGFFTALNWCVATSCFTTPQEAGQAGKNRPVSEPAPRMPGNLARERYLAIPTFIRQGKNLGL